MNVKLYDVNDMKQKCSFCRKPRGHIKKMIYSHVKPARICDECVNFAYTQLERKGVIDGCQETKTEAKAQI